MHTVNRMGSQCSLIVIIVHVEEVSKFQLEDEYYIYYADCLHCHGMVGVAV